MTVLGQLLIKSGLVTSRQVEAALRRQEQLGGRLGTCLLELGAISERQLDTALARQLGLPAAQVEDLREIPDEIHSLLPANLAISCEAVPFRVRDDQVDVAILEIKNRGLHDELAFVIGKWIHVHIANEIRIVEALERYYGKACTLRYRTLIDRLDRDRHNQTEESFASGEDGLVDMPFPELETQEVEEPNGPKLVYPPTPLTRRSIEVSPEEREALKEPAAARPAPVETSSPRLPKEPPPEVVPPDRDDAPASAAPAPSEGAKIEQHPSAPWRVENVAQVGETMLGKLNRHFERVALFRVQRDEIQGWMGAGDHLDRERLLGYRTPVDHAPALANLFHGGHLFVGRLTSNPAHDQLMAVLGSDSQTECLLSVVMVEGRAVAIAYGDRGSDGMDTLDFGAVQQVTLQAGNAMRDLILRMKRKRA